jgi:hypothetical protein
VLNNTPNADTGLRALEGTSPVVFADLDIYPNMYASNISELLKLEKYKDYYNYCLHRSP